MLSLQTIRPDTLELLKTLCARPEMQGLRLVGGTALARITKMACFLHFFILIFGNIKNLL